MIIHFLTIILAYLIGSVNFSIILSHLFNAKDPRRYGSSNPGATNMLRSKHPYAKHLALATLILDALKGAFVVLIAKQIEPTTFYQMALMMAVFLGHLYPIFFKFKGGKGIATLLGILLTFNLQIAFISILSWVVAFFLLGKRSSLAALFSLIILPFVTYFITHDAPSTVLMLSFSMLSIHKHQENISRLIKKKERPVL